MSRDIIQALRSVQSKAVLPEHARVQGWCQHLLEPYFKWYAAVKQELSELRSGMTVMLKRHRYIELCTELNRMLPRCNTRILGNLEDTVADFLDILRVRTLSVVEQARLEYLLEHLSDFQRPESVEARPSRERTLLEFLDSAAPPAILGSGREPSVLHIRRLPKTSQDQELDFTFEEITLSARTASPQFRTEELHCEHVRQHMRWVPMSDYDTLDDSFMLITVPVSAECILSTEDEGELKYYIVGQDILEGHAELFGNNDFYVLGVCRSRARQVYWAY
ncbi:hypothetical protein OE88DRAFT_1661903 [Heliocybe sulcata]|uniref:Uncharacterized protein n=1 Tax=Heliocybe sulcata TaxID=5364 RepID=A0A5C3MY56_9AGAM|nr:hypothetical protein OE88DRAFT_1661903 [Heliocybe sulcata]